MPEASPEEMKALALAYAKYLAENDLEPGEPTFTDSIPDLETEIAQAADPETEPVKAEISEPAEETVQAEVSETAEAGGKDDSDKAETGKGVKKKKEKKKRTKKEKAKGESARLFAAAQLSEEQIASLAAELEKTGTKPGIMSKAIDFHDRVQISRDSAFLKASQDFVKGLHRIVSTYRQSRRGIGIALLLIGILVALVLAIFDKYTVYEYAYNGKPLGYVTNQEEVTDVLDIAGKMLTENSSGGSEIVFIPNQNVTFNLVDGRGKSTDDADTAVNKLVYMTDIESEAFGVYDGDELAAVVKSNEAAEELLVQAKEALSVPDKGMELVSSDFTNKLDIRPINVLLTSVQSNNEALSRMTEGGKIEIYHIVEEGETLESLSQTFGVDALNIFNEDNSAVASEVAQGDIVCIHEEVEPISVKMVETGRMKETIEYDTIKKDSDDYYKGDTYTEQEGVDGLQIFDGTITRIGGKIARRDARSIEKIREKQDKIILVGTAERPKTAPTGTYVLPLDPGRFTITSNFGHRWGRLHSGLDMGAAGGTPIYATDGGTVVRAGWYSGYGNCVDIEHENGRMTRYGHCSRLLVNVGDKVYQGQNIALVGNTGHSFGNHLHFEVRFNGNPVDPRPYLGI